MIERFDMEHRIKKEDIINIEKGSRRGRENYQITFRGKGGEEKVIELYPKKLNEFATAIGALNS